MNWFVASKSCQMMNAQLASPNTVDDLENLQLFKSKLNESSIWLGFFRVDNWFVNSENEDFHLTSFFKKGNISHPVFY